MLMCLRFGDLLTRMVAKNKENRPVSMWGILKDLRAMSIFKRVPRLPEVHPFDQLEKGEQGFNID